MTLHHMAYLLPNVPFTLNPPSIETLSCVCAQIHDGRRMVFFEAYSDDEAYATVLQEVEEMADSMSS
ncbi:hypothetical protein F2Q70_00021756 [Brassica cretica]|uniref:Uncharacterized protein n=1 Tax=Brassica cretica TaxID=69181 RepID=A0A8S9GZJ4_BRACR|nr:hypothetical protein F2Q70_00021756 [Brassica cretica]